MKQPPSQSMMSPMLDCDSLIAKLWDYLDGELSPDRVKAVEAHLAECSQCSGHVEFERMVLQAIKAAREDAIDTEGLGNRVRRALATAGYQDPR